MHIPFQAAQLLIALGIVLCLRSCVYLCDNWNPVPNGAPPDSGSVVKCIFPSCIYGSEQVGCALCANLPHVHTCRMCHIAEIVLNHNHALM